MKEQDLYGEDTWTARAWKKDHLDSNHSCQLMSSCPLDMSPWKSERNSAVFRKFLTQHKSLRKPPPGIRYGLDADEKSGCFTKAENGINAHFHQWTGILPGLRPPAVFVYFDHKGRMARLEAHCARTGAALVNANRQLVLASGRGIMTPGADFESFVFSFAVVPDLAQLYVHWPEVTAEWRTIFHMHVFEDYILSPHSTKGMLNQWKQQNNPHEWIVGGRRDGVKPLLADINAHEN